MRKWTAAMSMAAMFAVAGLVWVIASTQPYDSEMDLRLKTLAVLALDNFHTRAEPEPVKLASAVTTEAVKPTAAPASNNGTRKAYRLPRRYPAAVPKSWRPKAWTRPCGI